jgi:SAM-dependent methyltransferase
VRVDPDVAPRLYGESYREALDHNKAATTYALFRQIVAECNSGGRRLLDIGSGDGSFLLRARDDGWTVAGMDADSDAVKELERQDISGIVAAIGERAPDIGSFDVVTLWDVLEHVLDPEESASWLARTVSPGGIVIVLTPNATSIFDRFAFIEYHSSIKKSSRLLQLCLNRYHRFRYSRSGLQYLFQRFGFTEVSSRTIQLLSLRPEVYLDGFAPGIQPWTTSRRINRAFSRTAYGLVGLLGLRNKLLYVGRRV